MQDRGFPLPFLQIIAPRHNGVNKQFRRVNRRIACRASRPAHIRRDRVVIVSELEWGSVLDDCPDNFEILAQIAKLALGTYC